MIPSLARSQTCNVNYEEVMKLLTNDAGNYSIWDTVQGEVGVDETYKAGVVIEGGDVVVAGERLVHGAPKKQLVIARLGRNGRVLWETFHDVAGLESTMRILPHEKGFLIVADQKLEKNRDAIWIGILNPLGNMIDQKQIVDQKASLHIYDAVRSVSNKSYLLATTSAPDSLDRPAATILYKIDNAGKVIGNNGFMTGMENKLQGLDLMADGGVIGTGYSFTEDGRKNGWILRLNQEFNIMWQQVYPRGAGATLSAAQGMLNNTIAVVGTAAPAKKGGLRAGWIMVVDADSGVVGWQRYVQSDQHYSGRDLMVSKDGLISVMLDGDKGPETQEPEHIRLLTLNPRGAMLASEIYMNAETVDGYQLLEGPNLERIVIGRTQVAHQIEKKDAKADEEKFTVERSKEGWVVAAPSVEPYKDPCVSAVNFLP